MSIIFFGTPDFSVPTLNALINNKEDISLVVTQPDKRSGRGKGVSSPPVKAVAVANGIDTIQPPSLSDAQLVDSLKDRRPEFIVTVAYGKILPETVLAIPDKGCLNVHASLLPEYRGAAPIQWSILNGEIKTGVTTMMMDTGMDTGDILLQSGIDISENDTYLTLAEKLSSLGADLLISTLKGIRKGDIVPRPQTGTPTYAPMIRKEDGRVDWHKSAAIINNLIRGMFPWPCAFTFLKDKYIKIHKAAVQPGQEEPGRMVLSNGERLLVGTSEGLLALEVIQPEGKKPMDARAFINGYRIKDGERLG
ncbi:MAG: methionyl-tRNA formyltransferase [Nitrospirota bacterium]|nr:MAG: methionyl-tRNA formyltransferase [Nitrospirota bacterium]